MRVNIYAEEMTERVEIISKEIEGNTFTGLRLYLELPVSYRTQLGNVDNAPRPLAGDQETPHGQLQGPFIHHPGDDDSAAVTFWGKKDLRVVLQKMIEQLDIHYAKKAGYRS